MLGRGEHGSLKESRAFAGYDGGGMHRGMESRALDQYRLDSMTAKLALDKDAVHRDIVGTIAYERATLAQVREHADERKRKERAVLENQLRLLREEIDKERKARRAADLLVSQLQQRLETIEAKHGKQRIGRIDADLALKKAVEKHARVAAEKRELVTRFDKLLHAYRSLVEAYMQLKEKYTIVKSIKPLTTSEKVRLSLRKVRELFTQEDEDDPDRLPVLVASDNPKARRRSVARCTTCTCAAFQQAPASDEFCVCGHDQTSHGL